MALTSLQITPSRAEAVEFTVPYLETGTSIIVSLRNDTISAYAILGLLNRSGTHTHKTYQMTTN